MRTTQQTDTADREAADPSRYPDETFALTTLLQVTSVGLHSG
jgi:hypothetical protein